MTDNEIIKEFELFIKYSAPEKLLNDVFELINRKNAEIESLQTENRILSQKRINFFERIELVNNAREKAIKEFAERLKELKQKSTMDSRICTSEMIDNLVKEMTAEASGNAKG